MINPTAELYTAGIAQLLPLLVMLTGTLALGALIGHWYAPVPKDASVPLRLEIATLRSKLTAAEDRQNVAAGVLAQRAAIRDDEVAADRRAAEQEIAKLNAQASALKVAIAVARRPVQPMERVVVDPRHEARIAELERVVARVPALLKEIDALRALIASETDAPAPLPRSAGATPPGKRAAQNDLKLVEGIGPKIAEHLQKHGLRTWSDVARAKPEELKRLLKEGGDRLHLHDPSSWPKQCRLMVEDRWEELRRYQQGLVRARR